MKTENFEKKKGNEEMGADFNKFFAILCHKNIQIDMFNIISVITLLYIDTEQTTENYDSLMNLNNVKLYFHIQRLSFIL